MKRMKAIRKGQASLVGASRSVQSQSAGSWAMDDAWASSAVMLARAAGDASAVAHAADAVEAHDKAAAAHNAVAAAATREGNAALAARHESKADEHATIASFFRGE